MMTSSQHQAWLFYMPLAKQAALLKDDLLEPVDRLLEDAPLIELVRHCLGSRSPASTRTGRPSMAPDRLLRCCVLKHLKGWSFRQLARELPCNLIYRQFTHFDAEATRDHSVFSRTFALLSPEVTEKIHQRVVGLARQKGVAKGHKMRTDTTAVESNVHFPTDSALLGDGIRVLSRSLKRIATQCKRGALEVVHHGRAVKHRLLEISRAAKSRSEASRQRMCDSYDKLLALTRKVVRQASEVVQRWKSGRLKMVGNPADSNSWMPALDQHQACFGHLPQMATADRGFFSAKNESEAEARGVAKVALPARGRLSRKRAERQKQRWFKRALRWRAGCEATISTLKHPFSMWRATYKGEPGFQRYVGWSAKKEHRRSEHAASGWNFRPTAEAVE